MASARIIVNSRYCRVANTREAADGRNTVSATAMGNLVTYVGSREGVIQNHPMQDGGERPATEKQNDRIRAFLRAAPELERSLEYTDFQAAQTMANASALISAGTEILLLQNGLTDEKTVESLVRYVGTRPGVDRQNEQHGLFGYKEQIDLREAADELSRHTGRIWRHVVSLCREDADRLGYNRQEPWRQLVQTHLKELAELQGIKSENLRWYAGMHNEGHHPHIHLLVWSVDPKEGYLPQHNINRIKSMYARDIFREDLQPVYAQKTEFRDALTQSARELLRIGALQNSIRDDAAGGLSAEASRKLTEDLRALKATLPDHGRMVYKYMPPEVKGQIDSIAEEMLAASLALRELYERWQDAQREIDQTYGDDPPEREFTKEPTFNTVKNAILQAAVQLEPEPSVDERIAASTLASNAASGDARYQYQYAKHLLSAGLTEEADIWLRLASVQGHIYASITLAEQYHAAGAADLAQHYFYEAYSQILNTAADANAEALIHVMTAEHPNREILVLMDPDTPYVGRLEERLASMVERGIGTEPNRERAMVLYEMAAAHGSDRAVAQYERLYTQDHPDTERTAAEPPQPEEQEVHDTAAPAVVGRLALSVARLFSEPAQRYAEQKRYTVDRQQRREEQKKKAAMGYHDDSEN